jgi:hypothetical protein
MTTTIRVNTSSIRRTIGSRTALGQAMASQAPQSALYQNQPTVKTACDAVVTAGKELADAEKGVTTAKAVLANALKTRATKKAKFDSACTACVGQVEMYATKPEDVTSVALTLLERQSHDLAPPTDIEVKYDAAKGAVRVHVALPPGITKCLIEVTTNPNDETTYKRLAGVGISRKLTGYAPGTYWFRAASVRASDESAWCTPVSVIVK